MRIAPSAAAALAVLAVTLPACGHSGARRDAGGSGASTGGFSAEEQAKRDCSVAFAACAPPVSFSLEAGVDDLGVRSLVQISWRMDLDGRFTERAAKRLRKLAERGDLDTVREIARAGDIAESTLGRCRCAGEDLRPEWEKQGVGEIVAGRLPPAELQSPSYWSSRIDPLLARLRALSRRSAELAASGDDASLAAADADVRAQERSLCEHLHAARDVLSDDGMAQLRALVYEARARESGDASVAVARRDLERAELRPSCAADGGPAKE